MEDTITEVTREDEELVSDILDAFDTDSWDDDDSDFDLSDEGSGADDGPIDGYDSDGEEEGQPETDSDEDGESGSEEGQTEEPREEAETGNQRFRINYLGNEEEYDLAQMTELAQKGRNYDHVVEERDRLKGEVGKGKHDDFLEELARRAGKSVEEQIDLTRAMWLMNDEFDKGNEISEADALLRVQREKKAPAKIEDAKSAEPPENKTNQMIDRFLAVYPDVKATDIPKEVWDSARQTGDLLGAYQALEIKRLRSENEKIRQEARNEQNARRSTGPRKSSGSTKEKDDFDAAWDSDY